MVGIIEVTDKEIDAEVLSDMNTACAFIFHKSKELICEGIRLNFLRVFQ